MKKLFLFPLLLTTTLFANNIFAADICKFTKTATISATNEENAVGLDYDTFNIKHSAKRKNSENNEKEFGYDNTFFMFREYNAYLTPEEFLNVKQIKNNCIESLQKWQQIPADEVNFDTTTTDSKPVFLTKNKQFLVVMQAESIYTGGPHEFGGYWFEFFDTDSNKKIDKETLIKNSFKDKNFSKNPQLVEIVKNKIKADKDYYDCLFDKGENLYFPQKNIGIIKNKQTKQNNLVAVFSIYEIAPYVCGPYEIYFTPKEINPFLNTNSILYKILNDEN